MNLHEYQAKNWLRRSNIAVPNGFLIRSPEELLAHQEVLSHGSWVIKVQIHAGGRGRAGGVKMASNWVELQEAVRSLLGKRLVTVQNAPHGQPVHEVLLEPKMDFEAQWYVSIMVDRAQGKLLMILSPSGGMDIEQVAQEKAEQIHKIAINLLTGLCPYQLRILNLPLSPAQLDSLYKILEKLVGTFLASDLSLLEINPLVLTKSNTWLCLDAKMSVDDNAVFRQIELKAQEDVRQNDPREEEARRVDLQYVAMEGNIGCLVNGAGLAMATMDTIDLYGGKAANFLDVGGNVDETRLQAAFAILQHDQGVRAILVNIFGGIVQCDAIALGLIAAFQGQASHIPIVVRLAGNKAAQGLKILRDSHFDFLEVADSLEQAVQLAVRKVHSK